MDGSVLISLLYVSHALETTRMFEWFGVFMLEDSFNMGGDQEEMRGLRRREVCCTAKKLKNVCQVCLLDLEYGLPVQVRDTALAINSNDAIQKSDVNREYFVEEHDRRGAEYCNASVKVNDPVALKLLNKAGEMPSLVPPEDESIKTLYVGGLNERISEQDLRDQFYAHGEIESVRMVLQRACAFVTYTTREAAEKAAEELSNKLVIRGLRLKLLWGKSLAAKAELENHDDEAARQAALAHGGMLPRAVISQQQNQQVPPPGTQDQPPPMHYFNIPPPPPERAYYPSMDPQRMGALVPSQEASGSGPPPPLRSNMDT
ncbi:hypothetical protein Syun_018019 [Stephania yunnanensis]|uniref:RRM domain-containing protein n=1 Tax=Stephania yunnanensis TaxID=152371 RepID=A0AAP0IRI0_9MAGN